MRKINFSRYLRYILSIVLLVANSAPSAAEYSLVTTVASYHLVRKKGLNEVNPGLGLMYSEDIRSNWGLGFYRNSFRKNSVEATYTHFPVVNKYVRGGAFVGLVTGYPQGRVLPAAGLQTQVIIDRTRLNVYFVPPVKRVGLGGVFAFQLLHNF